MQCTGVNITVTRIHISTVNTYQAGQFNHWVAIHPLAGDPIAMPVGHRLGPPAQSGSTDDHIRVPGAQQVLSPTQSGCLNWLLFKGTSNSLLRDHSFPILYPLGWYVPILCMWHTSNTHCTVHWEHDCFSGAPVTVR